MVLLPQTVALYILCQIYNCCFMQLSFKSDRGQKRDINKKYIYTMFCIYLCHYFYCCSLFLHVNSGYCLVSFRYSTKDSL